MEIRKVNVNGNVYEFVNESGNTRNGFYHKTTVFKNGCEVGSNRCNYLNRTWECYRYQTVMMGGIYNMLDRLVNRLLETFKADNGYKKMTENRRIEFDLLKANNELIKEYEEVLKQLR